MPKVKKNRKKAARKKAPILMEKDIKRALRYFEETTYPERDRVIFLLGVKCWLRACEVAGLTWEMVTQPDGSISEYLRLSGHITKGGYGERNLAIHDDLKDALQQLRDKRTEMLGHPPEPTDAVVYSQHGDKMSAKTIVDWYIRHSKESGIKMSSHSPRRTGITKATVEAPKHKGSIFTVMKLAGHARISSTQEYVEYSEQAGTDLMRSM